MIFAMPGTRTPPMQARTCANLRELMERMGHATNRAAMIYLLSTDQRQRILADAVDKAARAELRHARRRQPKTNKPARATAHLARKWHMTANATREDHQIEPRNRA